jgi:predicted transcriptional regulator
MDPAQLRRIEAGAVAITLTTLVRLSRAFEEAPSSLVAALDLGAGEKLRPRRKPSLETRLARNIAALRARHGLTQRELAAKAGVGVSVVSMVEARRTSPTVRSVSLIAAALGVDPDELLR